jgi:hypothetical protein
VTGSIDFSRSRSIAGVGVVGEMLAIFLLQSLYCASRRRAIQHGRDSCIHEHEEGQASIDISC